MFLNDTFLLFVYTANIMSTLPNQTNINDSANSQGSDVSTTTLSPEERDNRFDPGDGKFFRKINNL